MPVKCDICGLQNKDSLSTCKRCGTPLAAATTNSGIPGTPNDPKKIRRGQIIANRYVVLDLVGQGGMGSIYRVKDNTLDEEVALKTLLPNYAGDPLVVERFFNEARIARALSHPNITRVHDIGSMHGLMYISMEFLEGKSLRQMLEELLPGDRLPIKQVLDIFDGLCAALAYAHDFTVHRDLKPENVMILPDGSVKLMDFGISKLMSTPGMTSASMIMGTPHYMSPEQLKNSAGVDGRADLYSMGVMLYEILTGVTPTGVPQSASKMGRGVPPAFDAVIAKCLEADPNKRYRDANELREALANIRGQLSFGGTFHPNRSGGNSGAFSWNSLRKTIGIVAILLILAGAGVGLWQAEQARAALPTTTVRMATVEGGEETVAPGKQTPEQILIAMQDLIPRALNNAEAAIRRSNDLIRSKMMEDVLENGKVLWKSAEESTDDSIAAVAHSWRVLHQFLAVVVWPEDMFFIPPRIVETRNAQTQWKAGYFVDENMVSVSAFKAFCADGKGWKWPQKANTEEVDSPMNYVSYYDALAYGATQQPPRQLPTEAQWLHALGYTAATLKSGLRGYDGFLEWVRPETTQEQHEFEKLLFGMQFPVCGVDIDADGESTISQGVYRSYEDRLDYVGFRCVYELPTTLEAAAALLP